MIFRQPNRLSKPLVTLIGFLLIFTLISCGEQDDKNSPLEDPTENPDQVPALKPTCCGTPLSISILGSRWKARSAYISTIGLSKNMLRIHFYPTLITTEVGCNGTDPLQKSELSWDMDRNLSTVLFNKDQFALVYYYTKAGLLESKKIRQGHAQLGAVAKNKIPIAIDLTYDSTTWASGTFDADICPGVMKD